MSRKISWRELTLLLALLLIGAVSVLPMFARARESARRSSCQNNLKQLGLVMKMFANEEKRNSYPPRSPIPGNWIFDMHAIYPEYLTDLSVLICPSSPYATSETFTLRGSFEHPRSQRGQLHPDCVSPLFYNYTGYVVSSDEQAWALYEAFRAGDPAARAGEDIEWDVPVWENTGRRPQGGMPMVWDRPPLDETELVHQPGGLNVVFADGHVEFLRYSPLNRSNNFPATRLAAEIFGTNLPRLSRDCY